MKDWRKSLLHAMGYKPTAQNLRFLSTWQRWEGGHTNNNARFNWLNTTHGSGESINSVGVKRFQSYDQGIRATAETLMNGRYQDILDGLASGNPFAFKPSAGLQTWVSGRPDGNPGYASKVLGTKAGVSKPRGPRPSSLAAPPDLTGKAENEAWNLAVDMIFEDKPEIGALLHEEYVPKADPGPTRPARYDNVKGGEPMKPNGKMLQTGVSWEGTHVTDGLDWNGGKKTARDIMAAAGTAVLAPESGTIVRWGSAQGGQALYFMSDSGHLYWMGHIDNMAAVGTRVKRGQQIALISADHAAPHLHIDRYYGDDPGRYT